MFECQRVTALVLAAVAACVSAGGCSTGDSDDEGAIFDRNRGSGGGFGGDFLAGGSGAGGGPMDDCTAAARLIYLLSEDNSLYSFDPAGPQVLRIGTLACQTAMQPNSMAIDRDAVAWVNYVGGVGDAEGAIYKVSTADASCESTPTVTLTPGWFRVGMGFATDGANTQEETLFVAGINTGGALGRIDMASGTVETVGAFTGPFASQNAELTGTGDGRLFGFFTSTPVEVAALDKMSGDVTSSTPLPSVEQPIAWAFSFWGGDFYLYTAGGASESRVNRYRPADGSVDTSFIENVGFRIVGAGGSTCAPLELPKWCPRAPSSSGARCHRSGRAGNTVCRVAARLSIAVPGLLQSGDVAAVRGRAGIAVGAVKTPRSRGVGRRSNAARGGTVCPSCRLCRLL